MQRAIHTGLGHTRLPASSSALTGVLLLALLAATATAQVRCGINDTGAVTSILRSLRAALRPGGASTLPPLAGTPARSSDEAGASGNALRTTAATVAPLSHAAHYQAARLLQEHHCAEYHPMALGLAAELQDVPGWPYKMVVLKGSDLVSQAMGHGVGWEAREVYLTLQALQAPLPDWAPEAAKRARPVLLDVGANLGTYTLAAASHGYEVVAFEASRSNRQLLRESLCANPGFVPRVTLYPYGLWARAATCYLVAQTGNLGNQVGVCGARSEAEALTRAQEGMNEDEPQRRWGAGRGKHVVTGTMQVLPLDDVLYRAVKVMKVDVEGHEVAVLRGAWRLLSRWPNNVWFLLVEFNLQRLRQNLPIGASPTEFVHDLLALGYEVSLKSFTGPFLDNSSVDEQLVATRKADFICNLFFARLHSARVEVQVG